MLYCFVLDPIKTSGGKCCLCQHLSDIELVQDTLLSGEEQDGKNKARKKKPSTMIPESTKVKRGSLWEEKDSQTISRHLLTFSKEHFLCKTKRREQSAHTSSYSTCEALQYSQQKSLTSDALQKKNRQLPHSFQKVKSPKAIETLVLTFTSALHGGWGTPKRGIQKGSFNPEDQNWASLCLRSQFRLTKMLICKLTNH